MIEIVRYTQRNVKRWRDGDMQQALDRRRHARRRAAVPAHHRLPRPRQARHRIERHALLTAQPNLDRKEVAELVIV
jgi:hypothetical protein